ncbi:MAG: hypothetical protein R3Y33_00145 [Clostridia bacterium]
MNPKIKKIINEIQKNQEKIDTLHEKNNNLIDEKKEIEQSELLEIIKSIKFDDFDELTNYIRNYKPKTENENF